MVFPDVPVPASWLPPYGPAAAQSGVAAAGGISGQRPLQNPQSPQKNPLGGEAPGGGLRPEEVRLAPGDYVAVRVDGSGTAASLRGVALGRVPSLQAFHAAAGGMPFWVGGGGLV